MDLDPTTPLAKPCTGCGETKILDLYYRGTGRWGRQSRCKKCTIAASREWHLANRDRSLDIRRQWAEKNRRRINERQRAYDAANRELITRRRQIHLDNRD